MRLVRHLARTCNRRLVHAGAGPPSSMSAVQTATAATAPLLRRFATVCAAVAATAVAAATSTLPSVLALGSEAVDAALAAALCLRGLGLVPGGAVTAHCSSGDAAALPVAEPSTVVEVLAVAPPVSRLHRFLHGCRVGLLVVGRIVWVTLVLAPLVWTLPIVLMVEGVYRLGRLLSFRKKGGSKQQAWMHLWPLWYWQLAWSLQFAGPLAIKFGQWASTRPDVFSRSFCKALEVLHRGVRSEKMRRRTLRRIIRAVAAQCRAVAAKQNEQRPGGGSNSSSSSSSSSSRSSSRSSSMSRIGGSGRADHDDNNEDDDDDDSAYEDVFLEVDATPVGAGCIAQVHRAVLNTQRYANNNKTFGRASCIPLTAAVLDK